MVTEVQKLSRSVTKGRREEDPPTLSGAFPPFQIVFDGSRKMSRFTTPYKEVFRTHLVNGGRFEKCFSGVD